MTVKTRKNTKKEVIVVKEDGTQEVKALGKRTPLYAQKRVGIKDRPGYTRRLVNEKLGRVDSFLEAGWTPVRGRDLADTDNRMQDPKNLGDIYRPLVNPNGSCPWTHGVWMEIPTELYEEDQKAKLARIDEKENQIDPNNLRQQDPNLYYDSKFKKTFE